MRFKVQDGQLITTCRGVGDQNHSAYSPTSHRWLRFAESNGQVTFSTSPDGTNWPVIRTATHAWGDPYDDPSSSIVFSGQNSAASGSALEAFLDNVTVQTGTTPVGADPATLAAWKGVGGPQVAPGLFKPPGLGVTNGWPNGSRDMPAPTGFCESVFRVIRDPAIVTDDSGNTLGTQVYNHGWVLGAWLVVYLAEQNGLESRRVRPAQAGIDVVSRSTHERNHHLDLLPLRRRS